MIPTDSKERQDLVDLVRRRYERSLKYMSPFHTKWLRFEKIYRSMQDAVEDADEPHAFLPYAFGVIQDIVSRVCESLFKMRPPCRPRPKKPGHAEQAEKFSAAARAYFSSSDYQLEYTQSMTEEAVTGNAWEIDGWVDERATVKVWKQVPQQGLLNSMQTLLGKVIPLSQPTPYSFQGWQEVEQEMPVRVGYHTTFPSVYHVFPEPNIKSVRGMHWIVLEVPEAAISDLQKEIYRDPTTGQPVPVYDFSELLKDAGAHDPGAIKPQKPWGGGKDTAESVEELHGRSLRQDAAEAQDMDRVWLTHCYEPDRIVTIAQGKYVVRVTEKPWHRRPRIPFRLRRYHLDKDQLFGIGAIEPVEELIYELNDVHNLSMANWIRIINGMLVVRMDKIPFPDDIKPRPGGRIRVRGDLSVHDAVAAIQQADVAPSMLALESNAKGLMERTLSVADFSPGTEGTKQTHKTLGGLMEIQSNMNLRFSTILRTHLASYQDQMEAMEAILSQFQFERVPYYAENPDGSTALIEIGLEDVYTGGVGFDYLIEIDPSMGDDMVERNQLMAAFDLALKYEAWRAQFGASSDERIMVSEIMRKLLMSLGWTDTSKVLQRPDALLDPQRELDLMLQGLAVQVQPGEDKLEHFIEHTIQRMSPKLMDMVQSGKAPATVLKMLDSHLLETRENIVRVVSDPLRAADEKIRGAMISTPPARSDANGAEAVHA